VSGYVLSGDSDFDLGEIWEYISADNIEAADRWIGKLFDAFEAIGKTPGLGHRREDLTAYPVLFWPVDVGTNADVAGLKACSTKQHSRNQMWGGRPRPRRTPGPAFPASEQADQGVDRGPWGPPHQNRRGARGDQVFVIHENSGGPDQSFYHNMGASPSAADPDRDASADPRNDSG
jgi:hypothetical protein